MQRYKKIYGRESPKEFVPIFQSQNTFKIKKKQNNTTEKNNIKKVISKIKNQTNNAKGNNRNPNVLSNNKEKKTIVYKQLHRIMGSNFQKSRCSKIP